MLWKKFRHRKIHENNMVHDLLYATVSRDIKRVDELIQCGIDPCTQMEDGTSPIHKAAVMEPPYGPQIVSRMLSYGADPNVITPTGLSPLHIAAMWGRVETINVLLDHGADVLMKDMDDMSALDYADEAEENRIQCIDALTRYRSTPRRKSNSKSGYFLSKSRFNLQKIWGSDISFSDKDTSFKICEKSEETHDIFIEQESLFMEHRRKRKKKGGLQRRFSFKKFPVTNAAVQQADKNIKNIREKNGKYNGNITEKQVDSFATYTEILDIDVPDCTPNRTTIFHSCEEEMNSFSKEDSKLIISSTFIEDQTVYGSALSIQINSTVGEKEIRSTSTGTSSTGSSISSNDSTSSDSSISSISSMKRSTPKLSKKEKSMKSKKKSLRNKGKCLKSLKSLCSSKDESPVVKNISPIKKNTVTENDVNALSCRLSNMDLLKNFMAPSCENDTKLLIPISLPNCNTNNCNVNINICISSNSNTSNSNTNNTNNTSNSNNSNTDQVETLHRDTQTINTEINTKNINIMEPKKIYEEIIPPPIEIEQVDKVLLDDVIERLESIDDDLLNDGFISLNATDLTFDGENVGEATISFHNDPLNEPTIDYISNTKPFTDMVNYFQGKNSNEKVLTSLSTEEVTSTYGGPEKLLTAHYIETFLPPRDSEHSVSAFNNEKLVKIQESEIFSSGNDIRESSSIDETEKTVIAVHRVTESLNHDDSEKLQPVEEIISASEIEELGMENEIEDLVTEHNTSKSLMEQVLDVLSDENINLISSLDVARLSPSNNNEKSDYTHNSNESISTQDNENVVSSLDNRKSVDVQETEKLTASRDIKQITPESNKEKSATSHDTEKSVSTKNNAAPSVVDEKLFQIRDIKTLLASREITKSSLEQFNLKLITIDDPEQSISIHDNAHKTVDQNNEELSCVGDTEEVIASHESTKFSPEGSNEKLATTRDAEKSINSEGDATLTPVESSEKYVNVSGNDKLITSLGISELAPDHNKDSGRDTEESKDDDDKITSVDIKKTLFAPDNTNELFSSCDNTKLPSSKSNEKFNTIRRSGIPILVQRAVKLPIPLDNEEVPKAKVSKKLPTPHVTINEKAEYFESSEYYEETSSDEEMSPYDDSDLELLSFEELEKEFGCLDEVDRGRGDAFGCLDEIDRGREDDVPVVRIIYKPRGLMDELGDLSVEYGWKDVCQSDIVREFEHRISIPSRILTLHDDDLKSRLTKVGITANYISDRTRRIYQKHLVKIEMSDHVVLKPTERYEDYTLEMANVLCGLVDISDETGELLEKDMALQFEHPEKHTWREGTKTTAFNYLLLDPRVTNDLPERAHKMSFLQAFKVFVASIYFVGRGRKCRPNEHLEEATKYVFRPPTSKIKMIHDIWGAGLGVISLPVFNNIIPVEAFTREACIIEAMGTSRLTNVKRGDLYGAAASWNIKKQRFLGIYLLMKAMQDFLRQGEKQIRIKDIER